MSCWEFVALVVTNGRSVVVRVTFILVTTLIGCLFWLAIGYMPAIEVFSPASPMRKASSQIEVLAVQKSASKVSDSVVVARRKEPSNSSTVASAQDTSTKIAIRSDPSVQMHPGSNSWTFRPVAISGVQVSALILQLRGKPKESADIAQVAVLASALQYCHALKMSSGSVNVDVGQQPDCSGITAEAYKFSDELIDVLAQRGNLRAKLLYSGADYFWIKDFSNVTRHPERFAEYKANSEKYLHELTELGNTAAMVGIGAGAANPYWQEPDQVRSLGYLLAAAKGRGDANSIAMLSEKIVSLEPSDRARIYQISTGILQRCCN